MDLSEILAKLATLAEDETSDIELSLEELDVLHENFEQLDELSKVTLKSYIDKAADDVATRAKRVGAAKKGMSSDNKISNRFSGISKAADKLTKRGKYTVTKDRLAGLKAGRLAEDTKEDLDESEASDTLVPGSQPGDTKTSYLAALVSLTPYMSVEDLSKMYDDCLAMMGKVRDEISDDSAKNAASVAMKEDVDTIFASDETLTEEFKTKTLTLIEAAVNLKVSEKIVALEEAYENALNEELEELEEALVNKLDAYLDHVADEFMSENQVAVESALRTELTEDFILGLKNLFLEHNINLPEDQVDVVEDMATRLAELEEAMNDLITENKALKDAGSEKEKTLAIKEATEGLTVLDSAKLETIAEDLDYDSIDELKTKLETIKESYFKKAPKESNVLTEEFQTDVVEKDEYIDPGVKAIADAIGRTTFR